MEAGAGRSRAKKKDEEGENSQPRTKGGKLNSFISTYINKTNLDESTRLVTLVEKGISFAVVSPEMTLERWSARSMCRWR